MITLLVTVATLASPGIDGAAALHTNYMVRGIAQFHRPTDDFLSQKSALTTRLGANLGAHELAWGTALALQDREGLRAEVPHVESVQTLSYRYAIRWHRHVAELGAAWLASFQREGDGRTEFDLAWRTDFGPMRLGTRVLQHAQIYGVEKKPILTSYVGVQGDRRFDINAWSLLPYVRLAGEGYTRNGLRAPAYGAEGGCVVRRTFALGWSAVAALQGWYRADLGAASGNLLLGIEIGAAPDNTWAPTGELI